MNRISKRREPDSIRRLICARSRETRVCPMEAVWLTVLVRLGCLICHRTMLTEVTWDRVKIRHGKNEKRLASRQRTRLRTISFTLEDISRRLLVDFLACLSHQCWRQMQSIMKRRKEASEHWLLSLKVPKVDANWWATSSIESAPYDIVVRSESKLQYRHLIDNSSQFLRKCTLPNDCVRGLWVSHDLVLVPCLDWHGD